MDKLDLDLNLDNYELEDLLSLFQLPYNFDKEQLKSAKKIVLKTHPDKNDCDLLKRIFLIFFCCLQNALWCT